MRGLGDWPHSFNQAPLQEDRESEVVPFRQTGAHPAPHPASPRKRRGEVKRRLPPRARGGLLNWLVDADADRDQQNACYFDRGRHLGEDYVHVFRS